MRNRSAIKQLIKPRSAPAGATPPTQPAPGTTPAPAGDAALPKEDPNAPK
jgi:hypothetical protein